jgi:hypothetical protein
MTQTLRSGLGGLVLGIALLGGVQASEVILREESPAAPQTEAEPGAGPKPRDSAPLAMEQGGLIESVEDSARWNMEERKVFTCEMTEPGAWICGYGRVELVPRRRK